MKVDFEKVGTIAAYFAENTEKLYVTKLLKLFYYLDFISYKTRGASVTNDIYFKLPYGPVPTVIKNEIDTLSVSILGDYVSQLSPYIKLKPDSKGYGNLIESKGKINVKKLSESELKLMKHLAAKFKNTTAKVLSNKTHKEKPWLSTSDNAVIDYGLAQELNVTSIL